jgi:hypothetical protein
MFELFWDIFWIIMGFVALALHWPVLLAVFFFILAGVVWLDIDDLF